MKYLRQQVSSCAHAVTPSSSHPRGGGRLLTVRSCPHPVKSKYIPIKLNTLIADIFMFFITFMSNDAIENKCYTARTGAVDGMIGWLIDVVCNGLLANKRPGMKKGAAFDGFRSLFISPSFEPRHREAACRKRNVSNETETRSCK